MGATQPLLLFLDDLLKINAKSGQLKTAITALTETIIKKCRDAVELDSFKNTVACANHSESLVIDEGERRRACFRVSDVGKHIPATSTR